MILESTKKHMAREKGKRMKGKSIKHFSDEVNPEMFNDVSLTLRNRKTSCQEKEPEIDVSKHPLNKFKLYRT